jgi:uncharacterized protein YbjT (DUF2867 family)
MATFARGQMRILVIGGTGMVGSQVVRELVGRGQDVHVLSRDGGKAKGLPAGTRGVTGDLLDVNTIRSVFRGMDAVFLINSVSTTEAHEGILAVNGARMAGVGRIVYVSVQHADGWAHLPHFGAKVAVELAITQSGIPHTIVRPNNLFQNDIWMKQGIVDYGVYPQPLGDVGSSRVDLRDVAEIAANALVSDGHAGKSYNVVGPEILTGTRCAEVWSEALGKPVAYAGNDLDAWERQSLQYMPPWLVFNFRMMYEAFQRHGFVATAEDVAASTTALGHPPRDYTSFAREMAAQWKE